MYLRDIVGQELTLARACSRIGSVLFLVINSRIARIACLSYFEFDVVCCDRDPIVGARSSCSSPSASSS